MMIRPFLKNTQDGYGQRDRVFDYFHNGEFCTDPDVVNIINQWVPPILRNNKWVNKLICLMFHSEHYRNRTDPGQINFRFWLGVRLFSAIDRAELDTFVTKVSNEEELNRLESLLLQIKAIINSLLRAVETGKKRIAKEKADQEQSA